MEFMSLITFFMFHALFDSDQWKQNGRAGAGRICSQPPSVLFFPMKYAWVWTLPRGTFRLSSALYRMGIEFHAHKLFISFLSNIHDWLGASSADISVYAILCCMYYTSVLSNVREQVNRLNIRVLENPKGFLMHLDAYPFEIFFLTLWQFFTLKA